MSLSISPRRFMYLQSTATTALMLALLPTQAQAHRRCSDRFEWFNDDDDHDFNSQFFRKDCIGDGLSTGQIVGIVLGSVGAIILLIGLLTCLFCRRRRRNAPVPALAARPGIFSKFGRNRGVSRKPDFQPLGTPAANAAVPTESQQPMTTTQV